MRVIVIDGDRQERGLSKPVMNYRVAIYTTSRCEGFVSKQSYMSYASALNRAKHIENLLKSEATNG